MTEPPFFLVEEGRRKRGQASQEPKRSSQGLNEPGKFSYQLILDKAAEEAPIILTADAKVVKDLIHDPGSLYWNFDGKGHPSGRHLRTRPEQAYFMAPAGHRTGGPL